MRETALVARLLGWRDFLRWSLGFVTEFKQSWSERSLGPLDQNLGDSFSFRASHRQLTMSEASFGVVREIFGQHAYVTPNDLATCRTIVDLGANCGTFSLFALVYAPAARVYAIDVQSEMITALEKNIAANGYSGRISAKVGMIGAPADDWSRRFVLEHPEVQRCDLEGYMRQIGPCDFLKCDIEGGEFHIVNEAMHWLDQVKRFSMEYHGSPSDGERLASVLRRHGFEVTRRDHGCLGYLDGSRC